MSKRTKKQRAINVQPPVQKLVPKVEPLTHGMPHLAPAPAAAVATEPRTTDLHGTYCGLTTKLTGKTALLQLVGLDDYVKAQFDETLSTGRGLNWQGGFRMGDFKLDAGCKWQKS
jgi:hypothetical protein